MTVALAGHPPPVISAPEPTRRGRGHPPGPPLGSGWGHRHASTTLAIAPGTTVVLYTDGLVERRGESIDVGIERLRAAISPAHPSEVTADLMHQLVGTTTTHDDIALGRAPKSRNLDRAQIAFDFGNRDEIGNGS